MTLKVIIAGGDSWYSKGDNAILFGTLQMLNEKFPNNLEISILTEIPDITSKSYPGIKAIYRRNLFLVMNEVRKSDLFIWGGGQLIQNYSSRIFLIFQLLLLLIALAFRVPILGFGIGVAELHGKIWKYLVAYFVDKFGLITVRDERSRQDLISWGVKHKIIVTSDPALSIRPTYYKKKNVVTPCRKIIFCPRSWYHYKYTFFPNRKARLESLYAPKFETILENLASIADWCVDQYNFDVLFVPMYPGVDQSDDKVSAYIINKMRNHHRASIENRELNPIGLVDLFQEAEVLVTMRLHAAILASCSGTPSIMLYTQIKGLSFQERLGLEQYAFSIDNFTENDLSTSINSLIKNSILIRNQILDKVVGLRELAYKPVDMISDLLEKNIE